MNQEKIRERLGSVVRKHNIHKHAQELPGYQLLLTAFIDDILNLLHSEGVVIRLPNGFDLTGTCIARLEPLIKEQK